MQLLVPYVTITGITNTQVYKKSGIAYSVAKLLDTIIITKWFSRLELTLLGKFNFVTLSVAPMILSTNVLYQIQVKLQYQRFRLLNL